MTDKLKQDVKRTLERIKEGYPIEKYEGYKHHAEHTKECDMLFLVEIIEKYDLLHSVMRSDYPPDHVRIACQKYYKDKTPLKAINLVKKYTNMTLTEAKNYCESHFA